MESAVADTRETSNCLLQVIPVSIRDRVHDHGEQRGRIHKQEIPGPSGVKILDAPIGHKVLHVRHHGRDLQSKASGKFRLSVGLRTRWR
jgi:hypothetical protein